MTVSQAPSPFVAGTKLQYVWDSTSLGWLKGCPRYYEYSMIRGLRQKGDAVALKFGILYHRGHELFAKYQAEGQDYETALRSMVLQILKDTWEDGKPWDSGDTARNRENLIRSLIWHIEEFRHHSMETLVFPDGRPAVELSFKMDTGIPVNKSNSHTYQLSGHMDRIVKFDGSQYVSDHKTTKTTLGPYYFRQYEVNNQMSLYSLASQVVFGFEVSGVIIDAAQIAVGFTRFQRGVTLRTPDQYEEWLTDTGHWFRTAENYAANDYWPMNDTNCTKFGECPFLKVCSRGNKEVREKIIESNFVVNPWNPLEVR